MKYMPILRVQQSEYLSLGSLADDVRGETVPLLCQTPSFESDPADRAYRRLDLLRNHWGGESFYDPSLVVGYEGLDAATLYDAAASRGPFAPAIPVDADWASHARAAATEHGRAGLRVEDPMIVLEADLEDRLAATVDTIGLDHDSLTLIFDLGSSIDPRAANAVLRFPDLESWENVVLAGGAFLHEQQPTETRMPRRHLRNWRAVAKAASRTIVFGDYGTSLEADYQPPVSFPPAAKFSYTEPEAWLYVRGTSIARDGNEQMFDLARRVVDSPHWRGRDYSWGDEWIADRAEGHGSAGNAGMWIRAALSHHITHVVREDV